MLLQPEEMTDQRLKDVYVLAVDDDAGARVLADVSSDFSYLRTNNFYMDANQKPKEDLGTSGSETTLDRSLGAGLGRLPSSRKARRRPKTRFAPQPREAGK